MGIPPHKFEAEFLYEFYTNVESELRRYDKNIFLFIEPRVDWTVSSTDGDKSGFRRSLFDIKRTFHLRLIRDTMIEGKINSIQLHSLYQAILPRLKLLDIVESYHFIIIILRPQPDHF